MPKGIVIPAKANSRQLKNYHKIWLKPKGKLISNPLTEVNGNSTSHFPMTFELPPALAGGLR